jgi:acetate kinase
VNILVVNAGSSSVKLRVVGPGDDLVATEDLGPPGDDLADRLADFVRPLRQDIGMVGHRVVHGGPHFATATVVDDATRHALEGLNDLAPLHNPPALAGIDAARRLLPDVASVACFDTAFHAGLPAEAATYAVPADWVRMGVRRYGFHGLSCAWATRRAARALGDRLPRPRLIICHLGGGASVTAVAGGRSVDTTMGLTPLEGLVMATRSGDLDPGALLFVLDHGITPAAASDALEHHSGLLGLSDGRSSDVRELLAARESEAGDGPASLALAVYLHRLRAKIAAMAAATEGADALVFTGGVGEHAAPIRAAATAALGWIGVAIDEEANGRVGDEDADISAPAAPTRTLVIHAREDLQIASELRGLRVGP